MSYLRFKIPIKAVDAYLYGGYLYVFMLDGSIRYAKFDDLIWAASGNSVRTKNLLKLIFLPHQYLKGNTYKFLYSFDSIRKTLEEEQISSMLKEYIDLQDIDFENIFSAYTHFDEMPLDICIYGGQLFIASAEGVHKSSLNADSKYIIHPEKLKKIFDCPTVSLTAKAGMLAASAKEEGLFSHHLLENTDKMSSERPAYDRMSIKANWSMSYTLINYSDLSHFSLIETNVEKKNPEQLHDLPKNYRKDYRGQKVITSFKEKDVKMNSLMEDTHIDSDDIIYSFNTQTSGFFFLKDGSLQVRNIKVKNKTYQYSSKSVHHSDLPDSFGKIRPISAIAVPNGCLVETYANVLLIRENRISMIADEPVYGIRSYLSSNNYRNLVTIVYDDHVEVIAFRDLPKPASPSERVFRPGYIKEDNSPFKDPISDLDLPF